MNRRLSLVFTAALGLSAAPALADGAPQPAAPPASAPAPTPTYAPPPGYGQWYYPQGTYGPPPTPVRPPTERFSTPMMATGIALVTLGTVGILAGSMVYATRSSCVVTTPLPDGVTLDRCPGDPHPFIGTTILIASGLTAALGIPLWIFGARRVPVVEDKPAALQAPTLIVGPRSAAVRVTF